MFRMSRHTFFFCLSLYGLFLFSVWLQSRLLLSWDVSWLMHASERLLAGGTYTHDFFELNPPLILYLYVPPVWVHQFTSLSLIMLLRVYIYLIAAFSLYLVYRYVPQQKRLMTLTAGVAYLLLPLYEFGQRDHILLMCILPYLALIMHRLAGQSVIAWKASGVGLLAGIGFALKPYYLAVLVLVEMYYGFTSHRRFAGLRAETVAMAAFFFCYLFLVMLFHSDYLTTVVPIAVRNYHSGFSLPWFVLIMQTPIIFSVIVLLFFWVQRHSQGAVGMTLCMALVGCLIAYFIQRTVWYYHMLPAFSIATVLSAVLLTDFVALHCDGKGDKWFVMALAVMLYALPVHLLSVIYHWGTHYRDATQKLIVFLQQHASHRKVYFFATTGSYAFPAVDYAEAIPVSRYGFMGWIACVLKRHDAAVAADITQFTQQVVEDITIHQPDLLFVDVEKIKPHLNGLAFDYLAYFKQDAAFATAFKSYHYLTTLKEPGQFRLDVFERNASL